MWLFFAAAWVSVVGALCFVWFHRRKAAAVNVHLEEALVAKVRDVEAAFSKRLDTVEQRATRLELRANIRSQP